MSSQFGVQLVEWALARPERGVQDRQGIQPALGAGQVDGAADRRYAGEVVDHDRFADWQNGLVARHPVEIGYRLAGRHDEVNAGIRQHAKAMQLGCRVESEDRPLRYHQKHCTSPVGK
jgi:hypothetical protein